VDLTVTAGHVAMIVAVLQLFKTFFNNVVQTEFVCSCRPTDNTERRRKVNK